MTVSPEVGADADAVALLEVRGLRVEFVVPAGRVKAVDGVSFDLRRRRTLALVGESGSGKSAACFALMGLLDARAAVSGSVVFKGRELVGAPRRIMRSLHGTQIAMVFQDPMNSLNPAYRIGAQLAEAIRLHRPVARAEARRLAIEALREVGIPAPERRVDAYPHEFSGGMRQRVMIAMALVNRPDLLIADEPTTALDVTTQAQILSLLKTLQRERHMSLIFVTHDLGVVARIADEVAVMYAGRLVEHGPVREVFHTPRHPYSWGLLDSIPRMTPGLDRLRQISGSPPSPLDYPRGCRFHPRCTYRMAQCEAELPDLAPDPTNSSHRDACLLSEEAKSQRRSSMSPAAQTASSP
jgi:peptide/nickel transport system ATP-binding protein/oligopeptide transport system ATP-binding protein